MKFFFLTMCLLLIAATNTQAETIIRWVGKEGKVHYGDRPPEDAVKTEQKRFGTAPAATDDDLSYATRKAKQDFPVTLYATEKCGEYCVQARSFLNKRGIPYTEKMLITKEDVGAFKAKTGGNSIPALTVGKTLLSGFEAGQWNAELDIAGYPRIAPYGIRPVAPAVVKPPIPAEPEK
jgi:glutaredoxin